MATAEIRREVALENEKGLHVRAAMQFVEEANRFKSDIQLTKEERTVSGKSILGVITLAAEKGATLTVQASGEDASDAVESLESLIRNRFGEER